MWRLSSPSGAFDSTSTSYLVVVVIFVIILVVFIVIEIILIIKVALEIFLVEFFLEGLASEIVDSMWYDLFERAGQSELNL